MLVGAQKYASLRALGTPAGMLVMVLQSASFGFKDSRTPLKVPLFLSISG